MRLPNALASSPANSEHNQASIISQQLTLFLSAGQAKRSSCLLFLNIVIAVFSKSENFYIKEEHILCIRIMLLLTETHDTTFTQLTDIQKPAWVLRLKPPD